MEITANALQAVATGSNVVFTNTAVPGSNCILHREGAGLVTLRGLTNQSRARFRVTFGANVALPDGTADIVPISLAIAINGEPISATTMISSPTEDALFNSVSRALFLDVPQGCCTQISIENTSGVEIDVQNASLIVERVA